MRIRVFFFSVICLVTLLCVGKAGATDRYHNELDKILNSHEFDGASVSVFAMTAGGDTILCHDISRQLVPASNMKLVTTALALHYLGGSFRWETALGYSGEISDGILHGDIYIIGRGDPTLGSKVSFATPTQTVFSKFAGLLNDAGIQSIEGHVVGDGRWFAGMAEQESWGFADCGTYYGCGVSGLSFYENAIDFKVSPSTEVGSGLNIYPSYPSVPWMDLRYTCTTGKPDSGNSLHFYTNNFSNIGEMRGTLAINRPARTEQAANKFPEYTVAYQFNEYLKSAGISCSEGAADLGYVFGLDEGKVVPQDEITALGGNLSPLLGQVVEVTNRESDNFFAESLMRTLGKTYGGDGSYDSAYIAVDALLKDLGVDAKNISVVDGSGLSRQNHLSAEFLCSLLLAMTKSTGYGQFLRSLPYPGGQGTLASMLKTLPEPVRKRILMKSGSMGGVRCFSGYVLPEDPENTSDVIVFSIMVNNYSVSTSSLQKKLEEIITLLIH